MDPRAAVGAASSWLFTTIYDPFMRRTEDACLAAWRRDLLAGVAGDVLEIGAGLGSLTLALVETGAEVVTQFPRRLFTC